jgi:hypothetical protein
VSVGGQTAPVCPACGAALQLRDPPGGWTEAQRFCGTWWDHPPIPPSAGLPPGHTVTALDPSPQLRAQRGDLHAEAWWAIGATPNLPENT